MAHRNRMIAAGILMVAATTVQAVDTAFWKPYHPDNDTFFFANFDDAEGAVDSGTLGPAWRGPQAYQQDEPKFYLADIVSMEAWVKLERLPDQRAYVIRRRHQPGTTRGFELFVEPTGKLGMAVTNTMGIRAELLSADHTVEAGTWHHLAAISARGQNTLYVDGTDCAHRRLNSNQGLGGDRKKETAATTLTVADGIPGLVDEARVHSHLVKLWPKPAHPWIDASATRDLPAVENILLPGHEPVLHLDFENGLEPVTNTCGVKVTGKGNGVDGVRGKAFSGQLEVTGPMATATEGAIEFWSRPRGYCNLMDQNRTIVRNSLFNFYFWNSSHGLRHMTLYYRDREKELHFARDTLATEVYSGQWYHYLITWGNGNVSWYVNGRKASTAAAAFATDALTAISFAPYGFGDVDEVYAYDKELTEVEAANTWWRYVNPDNLQTPREKVADLKFWHLPSTRTLYTQISPHQGTDPALPVTLHIRDLQGNTAFSAKASFSPDYQVFALPELPSGEYRIAVQAGTQESPPQTLKRQRFAWENNDLGITDNVYPPSTPIRTSTRRAPTVAVVGRAYSMNFFGLWSRVRSLNRDILAGPIRLVARDEHGTELPWHGTLTEIETKPSRAVFRAQTTCPAVSIDVTSEIEVDGMMKVTLKLVPVEHPLPLQHLSLEIPLKPEIAQLMQEVAMHCRAGYTGAIPAGDGEVWTSKQTARSTQWLNAFTTYIWMGTAERGLCWFAENDKGWITAKNHEQPLQRITRTNDAVTLHIDLVNVPGTITEPTELTFGLQASPTKPLPQDFRTKAKTLPGVGLPVHPWGGLSCSWKSPWMDNWEVVDKVAAARNTGEVDSEWFRAFAERYNPPPVHGIKDWVGDVSMFASRSKPLDNPDPVYFEEMHVLPFIPEYHVFQDEWSYGRLPEKRYASVDVYRTTGGREINPNTGTNFSKSYQDYALNLMNEWWQRGVSIYWDNTYPYQVTNPWTSAAYEAEDGRIQPANTYWNQRAYLKRTWNLMNYWREKGTVRPLEFVTHMTNANILPFFTWSTCNYDMELSQSIYAKTHPDHYTPGEPFTPEYLRTTSIGRQVGNYPYLVHDLFQSSLPAEALGIGPETVERGRRSWGMRMVHEIISGGPQTFGALNKAIYQFGYGMDPVHVWNYWQDDPAFTVDSDQVKALLLTREKDGKMMLVLQSWSKEPLLTRVRLNADRIGFAPGSHAYEGLNNRHSQLTGNVLEVALDFPYETNVFLIDDHPPEANVIFADSFNDECNPGWDYLPTYAAFARGALRLGRNQTSWMGHPRLFKYLNLPAFSDAELAFVFRIETTPAGRENVLVAQLGKGLDWSKYGLTHSYLKADLSFALAADAEKGWMWSVNATRGNKQVRMAEQALGQIDDQPHTITIKLTAANHYLLTMDGHHVLEVEDPESSGTKNAFSLLALGDPAQTIGALFLDDIVLRADNPNYTTLENQRQEAIARSREIVAAQIDTLKTMIIAQFGIFGHAPIYNLAMFRTPEKDVAELTQRLQSEAHPGKRAVLLAVFRELPKRQAEHVESMKAIGQPASRLEEFRKARTQAMAALETWDAPPDAVAATADTIAALSADE